MRKSWHHTYLYLASELAVARSDHDFPVGAAVVDRFGQFVLGYNGLPRHIQEPCDDLIVHAEVNAINNAKSMPRADLKSIYVTYYPCLDCAKLIIQTGIKELIVTSAYVNPKYDKVSKRVYKILRAADVETWCYDGSSDGIWQMLGEPTVFSTKQKPDIFLIGK